MVILCGGWGAGGGVQNKERMNVRQEELQRAAET